MMQKSAADSNVTSRPSKKAAKNRTLEFAPPLLIPIQKKKKNK
jgi:hypothetical protein